jgi:hypothetical protein
MFLHVPNTHTEVFTFGKIVQSEVKLQAKSPGPKVTDAVFVGPSKIGNVASGGNVGNGGAV